MATLQETLHPDSESATNIVNSVNQRYDNLVQFTPGESVLIHKLGELSKEEFAQRAIEYDREPRPQTENIAALRRDNLMALVIPKELGGHAADYKTFAFATAEVAQGDRSTALLLMMNWVTNYIFDKVGSPEQRKRFAQEVAESGYLTATATSEGQSLNAKKVTIDTKFVPNEDGSYQVTGTKRFLSGARIADRVSLIGEGIDGFMLAVIYPNNTDNTDINPGTIEIRKDEPWDPRGMRATMSETVDFKVTVPKENIIGRPGEVFQSGLFRLFALGQAAVALGSAMRTRELFAEHIQMQKEASKEELIRKHGQMNKRISEMIAVLAKAADAFTDSENPNNHAEINPNDVTKVVCEAKLLCALAAKEITETAIEAGGGYAYARREVFKEIDVIHRDVEGIRIMPPNIDRAREVIGLIKQGKTLVKPLGFARSQTRKQHH